MPIDKHVIDTNVLLVASAAHDASPFAPDATPVEEAVLRKKVLDWLIEFDSSGRHIVLDWKWIIVDEYKGVNRPHNKLTEQDYGLQVVLHKFTTGQSYGFLLDLDRHGHAIIANQNLDPVINDREDRKMVAAVLASGCKNGGCNLVNSCDTDWYDWKTVLDSEGVEVHQLIPEWCYPKWQAKQQR